MKKWFLPKDHASKHTPKGPHVQGVIIFLQIDQQLRSFEIARGNANVVLSPRMIKFRKTPINESELAFFVINHDVVGFNIAVHDSIGVTVIQSLEELENVVPNVIVG
jgi:hypothetical protein